MTFDDILKQITEGLSGDAEQDIAYLNEQATAYSDHEQAQEIARACGRMIYERLPEEERQKAFDAMMEEDIRPMEAALSEARALIAANDLEKAQTVLEDLVDKADDAKKRGLFQDDAMSEYYCFSEPFEEMLYMFRKKPEREVRRSMIPFADIYSLYGQLLMARGDDRAANYVLKEAVRWNPANAAISFDYAASFKKLGDMEKFMEITRGIFSYAFRPADLARCYRNVGDYFIHHEQWAEAKGCILFGMQFDEDAPDAKKALAYIDEKTNGEAVAPAIEIMEALAAIHDFPLSADENIVQLSYMYGQGFLNQNNTDAARYFLGIAYGLTEAEELKLILDKI